MCVSARKQKINAPNRLIVVHSPWVVVMLFALRGSLASTGGETEEMKRHADALTDLAPAAGPPNTEAASNITLNKIGNQSNGPAAVTWLKYFCLDCYYG